MYQVSKIEQHIDSVEHINALSMRGEGVMIFNYLGAYKQ